MNKKEICKHITDVIEMKIKFDKISDDMYKMFGSADNDICNTTWKLFDLHTDYISMTIGDFSNMISWYIFDNNMGKGGLTASLKGGRMKKIDTVPKLVDFILAVDKQKE